MISAFTRKAAVVAVAATLAPSVAPAAMAFHQPTSSLVTAERQGLVVPISLVSTDQGRFTGQLRIVRFATDHGALVAIGIVSGTLVDETGVATGVVRMVSLPAHITRGVTPAGEIGTKSHLPCDILNLVLGPLDLDLLGLVVHLDTVVLDIGAVPGAGNLLGNLLCAITGLLDGVGTLAQIVALLNQLLDLLT
jgi:hypothetical protein